MKGPVDLVPSREEGRAPDASVSINGNGESRNDFSEYLWMGDEMEEFDKKVEEELWEEAFIEQCLEDMLDEEDEVEEWYPPQDQSGLAAQLNGLSVNGSATQTTGRSESSLNPNAPEFIPQCLMGEQR